MITTASPCKETPVTATPKPQAACSCCEGLECIEKPRFFCGQLLTDVDLHATVNYVSAKSRLHNRFLFGTGVVCGLTVHCDVCTDTKVVVDPGYALDCLGNDIVVCSPAVFDVAEALECKKKKEDPCGKPKDCDPPETEYCLVISYDEQHLNPVNALVRDQGCRTNRCEPSRTKESWRLQLIDEATAQKLKIRPSAWSRIQGCLDDEYKKLEAFFEELKTAEAMTGADREKALQAINARIRAAILAFAKEHAMTRCDILDRICELDKQQRVPAPDLPWTDGAATPLPQPPVTRSLLMLYMQLVVDCVCDAFLMPCEPCCEPEVVLLACLTIRDGKVVRICNAVRTQVIAGTSIRYWLQPIFELVGRVMEQLCCGDLIRYLPAEAKYSAAVDKQRQARNLSSMISRYSSTLADNIGRAVRVPTGSVAETITPVPLDLYNRPVHEAQERLRHAGIESTAKEATVEEAHSVRNLGSLGMKLRQGTRVELLYGPDGLVTSVREAGREAKG